MGLIEDIATAVLDVWLADQRPPVPMAQLEAWASGKEDIPEELADWFARVLGIARGRWPRIRPRHELRRSVDNLPPLGSTAVYYPGMAPVAQKAVSRRGRPPTYAQHAIWRALPARGYRTLREFAQRTGRPLATMAAYANGRRKVPEAEKAALQRELGIDPAEWDRWFEAAQRAARRPRRP